MIFGKPLIQVFETKFEVMNDTFTHFYTYDSHAFDFETVGYKLTFYSQNNLIISVVNLIVVKMVIFYSLWTQNNDSFLLILVKNIQFQHSFWFFSKCILLFWLLFSWTHFCYFEVPKMVKNAIIQVLYPEYEKNLVWLILYEDKKRLSQWPWA